MLTQKQYELIKYIDEHLRTRGFSPSFEDMKQALELRSKSGIHRLIQSLEERGFLRRRPHRARALEVLRMPGRTDVETQLDQPAGADGGKNFVPNVIHGDFGGRLAGVKPAQEVGAVELPLYGRIAAGLPIEALRAMVAGGEHFALEVAGDSMVDAGILDGDTVIIRKGDTAENGQIVVALVNGEEVTLKRLRRRGASVALEPANPRYEVQILPSDSVRVQGRLVALLRRY
jgi:repressor LexA